jgi:hypothetical protein
LLLPVIIFVHGAVQSNNLNETRIDVYVSETPAGTSVKNMAHWSQGVTTDAFQMFDYGCNILSCPNKQYYNQSTPPLYHLDQITTPIGACSDVSAWLRVVLRVSGVATANRLDCAPISFGFAVVRHASPFSMIV